MGDEANAKKDTGKKPRPKRDRNEPLPKAKKGGAMGRIVKVVILGAVVLACAFVGIYSAQIGKMPWDWSSEEQTGFVDFSKQQVDEATAQVDWEALKGQITEKTKELWDKASGFEDELDKKLASMRGARGETAPEPTSSGDETTSTPTTTEDHETTSSGTSGTSGSSGTSGTKTTPSEPVAASTPKPTGSTPVASTKPAVKAQPTELERGVADLRDAMKLYRASMKSQTKLKAAREKFESAQGHLEKARKDAKTDAEAAEIDDLNTECTTYLVDCRKRQTLR